MFKANNRNTRTATFEQVNVSWGGTFFFEAFIRAIHVIVKSATLKNSTVRTVTARLLNGSLHLAVCF